MSEAPTLATVDLETLVQSAFQLVCDQMLNMEMDYIRELTQSRIFGDRILASVNFIGNVMGVLSIQVSDPLAVEITSNMYNILPSEITNLEEVVDVVGELSNIMGGHIKSHLNDQGLNCILSPPVVTTGRDYKTDTPDMVVHEFFSFYLGDEVVVVEVGLKPADLLEENMALAMKSHPAQELDRLAHFDVGACVGKAVDEVFDVMIGLPISPIDPGVVLVEENHRINGSIGISGNIKGRVNVITTLAYGQYMTAAMIGAEPDEEIEDEALKDVVGEVCNIVSGSLKSALNDFGYTCIISPPSFTTGEKFNIQLVHLPRVERFCYESEGHFLCIEVGIEK